MTVLLLVMLLAGIVVAGLGLLVPTLWSVALVLVAASLAGLGLRAGGDRRWHRA